MTALYCLPQRLGELLQAVPELEVDEGVGALTVVETACGMPWTVAAVASAARTACRIDVSMIATDQV